MFINAHEDNQLPAFVKTPERPKADTRAPIAGETPCFSTYRETRKGYEISEER